MTVILNLADVPKVSASELAMPMRMLIEKGQGLALLRGLAEHEIRDLEKVIWTEFNGADEARLAVALRFRALLAVFDARRLKALFLERGFKLIAAAIEAAAEQPLNTRFGFNSQRILMVLDAATAGSAATADDIEPMKIAA